MKKLVFALVMLAACNKTLRHDKMEAQLRLDIVNDSGLPLTVTSVRCPSGVEAKPGVTMDCDVDLGDQGKGSITTEITEVNGTDVKYRWKWKDEPPAAESMRHQKFVQDDIRKTAGQSLGDDKVHDVRCPDDIHATDGEKFDCTVSLAEVGDVTMHVTVRAKGDERDFDEQWDRIPVDLDRIGDAARQQAAQHGVQKLELDCHGIRLVDRDITCNAIADGTPHQLRIARQDGNVGWKLH